MKRISWMGYPRALLALALFVCAALASAAGPAIPRLEGRVVDVAKVLSEGDRKRISDMLTSYERETSHPIAVLVVPALKGEAIEAYAAQVVKAWNLGQPRLDNGILVALSMEEKLIRIEIGKGMEKYIPPTRARSIIDKLMLPAFRKGDFAGGLDAGLQELMKEGRKFVVSAEPKPAPKK